MLEKPISSYILFGTTLWYLQTVREHYQIKGEGHVLENIDRFLSHLAELGLKVTERAAYQLNDIRKELIASSGDLLSKEQAKRLEGMADLIRSTLMAETGGMVAYVISERRFPTDRLLSDIGSLFGKDIFRRLPPFGQQDFVEAGKCLAFERPTAAAFHMLRGIESILRHYYCSKIKRKRSDLMWAAMVQSMRSMPLRFPKILLNQLDHMRDGFRNPTAHPEKIFDIDEAQDLLSICIDAANRMILGLDKNK